MADILESVKNLPDISFIDDLTLLDVQTKMVTVFRDTYEHETGMAITLQQSDPNRVLIYACAQMIYQGLQHVDKAGKMNLLKYAEGDFLDNLGSLKNTVRQEAIRATVPVKFTLSAARNVATGIPTGTRVTADYEMYFQTTEYAEIPAGETDITLNLESTEPGANGNNFAPGELCKLVDPIAYMKSISNTEESSGGSDIESDEDFAERIFMMPGTYSTAGTTEAYEYFAKNYREDIGDVFVTESSPGVVDIRFMLSDGTIPPESVITGMQEYLNQPNIKPLTDKVEVNALEAVNYDISVTYYINKSDSNNAETIQEEAMSAVTEYIQWQSSNAGRDINPDELLAKMKSAGVKRVVITSPAFTKLSKTQVAILDESEVLYGGLEDD